MMEYLTRLYEGLTPEQKVDWARSVGLKPREGGVGPKEDAEVPLPLTTTVTTSPPRQHPPGLGPKALRMLAPPKPSPPAPPLVDEVTVVEDRSQVDWNSIHVEKLFKKLDKNGNGYLDVDEFCAFYTDVASFGLTKDQAVVRNKLDQLNAFRDGKVSYNDFCILMMQLVAR